MQSDDMTEDLQPSGTGDHDDDLVVDAVKKYMSLLDAGAAPPQEEFLRQYPSIADDLRPSLEGLALVHRAQMPKPSFYAESSDAEFTTKPIGDFKIVGELGRGGMGVVYEAIQLSLGRRVALKVLPFASGLDEVRLQRFRNEAHAAAALHHTNIVPVYAVGSDRGVHYYAMQLIDGHTLAEMIANLRQESMFDHRDHDEDPHSSTLPQASATYVSKPSQADRLRHYRSVVRMITQAATAIEHAHQYGVVHRDIKPANLLLDAAGKIWVADFGLAQVQSDSELTRTGDPMGTLRYMSPEQASGNRSLLDHRTDIYSLGVTLYELLTLQPAIRGEGYRELLNQVAECEPISPKSIDPLLPTELDTIVRKAIAKSPSERFTSAGELADDLQSWLDDKPIKSKPPTTWERMAKWRRRNSGLVAVAGGLLLVSTLALSASTFMVWQQQQATRAALVRETEQRRLAELSFQQARSAVDTFSSLSESELAYRPDLQDLRRSFLETSLEFYRDFLEVRSDDPALTTELAVTSARVETMVDELRILDNISPLMQLSDPAVQQELAIDDATAESIDLAIMQLQNKRRSLANQNPGELGMENAEMTTLLRDFEAFVSQYFSASQLNRLRQIARQRNLPFTFKTSEVVAALNLTRQQRMEINRIIEQTRPGRGGPANRPPMDHRTGPMDRTGSRDRTGPMDRDPSRIFDFRPEGPPPQRFGDGPFGGDGPPRNPFGEDRLPKRGHDQQRFEATQETVRRILEILTPSQLATWNSLLGELAHDG